MRAVYHIFNTTQELQTLSTHKTLACSLYYTGLIGSKADIKFTMGPKKIPEIAASETVTCQGLGYYRQTKHSIADKLNPKKIKKIIQRSQKVALVVAKHNRQLKLEICIRVWLVGPICGGTNRCRRSKDSYRAS